MMSGSYSNGTAILVLGMHRSGTSLIARMLNLCGAALGDDMIPAKSDNERGFWENRSVLDLHERFLGKMGYQWHEPMAPPPGWERTDAASEFVDNLKLLLKDQFDGKQLFLVKDPRLSLLTPLWLRALAEMSIRPVFVVAVRHPYEVADSLARRDKFPAAQSLILWLQHLVEAERATRGLPRVFVQYERVVDDWESELRRITAHLDVQWPVMQREFAPEVDCFVTKDLRHHFSKTHHEALPAIIQSTYERACALCLECDASRSESCTLSEQFDASIGLIVPLYRAWQEHSAFQLQEHSAEIARARDTIHSRDAELAEARSAVDALVVSMGRLREIETHNRQAAALGAKNASVAAEQALESDRCDTVELTSIGALPGLPAAAHAELDALTQQFRDYADERLAWDNSVRKLKQEIVEAQVAHGVRDVTERILQDDIHALRASRWFRLGRALRILPAPTVSPRTLPSSVSHAAIAHMPLVANVDSPDPLQAEAGLQRITGWCLHERSRIVSLDLAIGPHRQACLYGLRRDDVGLAHSDAPWSACSGFEVAVSVKKGKWPLALVAVLDDGSESALALPHPLYVRGRAPFDRVARVMGSSTRLGRHIFRQGLLWLRERRGPPPLRDIPQLLRGTIERHRWIEKSKHAEGTAGYAVPARDDPYVVWQELNAFNCRARKNLQERLAQASGLPVLSVVMPVFNPQIDLLREAVASVFGQVYEDWELCIADDASTDAAVRTYLLDLAERDARVRLQLRESNGNISAATNSAAMLAQGEFIVLLDQDDLLTPDALAEIALCACAQADVDVLYSDDDKIDIDGRRFAPQFKPDWSPELLLSYMYFSHVFVVRRTLFAELEGMRLGFEGSQDHDFALRACERARRIVHIPRVLYHWRVAPGSTAESGAAKPHSFDAGTKAVAEALQRRNVEAHAYQPDWARKSGLGIYSIKFPDDGPLVSVLIPTYNGLDVLRRCIDSLHRTTYKNFEVIVVDNCSDDAATVEYLESLPCRVERIGNPAQGFSFAHINNRAAALVQGEYLLFLNNDTEVVEPRWLSQMVGLARFDGVGAVGARLLFPDNRIQHAGIVHGYYRGLAGPAFKLLPAWDNGYLSYARVARNYSAVTAACMLTQRKLFLELDGFDEERFNVAYNDVDYCYRLSKRGMRSVYCPDAELIHHEGHSRGFCDNPQEIAEFRRKYSGTRDAYYSPHLALNNERFEIIPRRFPAREGTPVRALMCAFNLNWEGAPYSQLELTLGLKRGGHVEPIVFSPEDGPLRAAYEAEGIPVHVFAHPLAGVFTEVAYESALDAFGNFVRSLDVDVVYGNTLQTFYAIDTAHRAGIPSLWNPRESEPWQTYFDFLTPPLAARALACFRHPYRIIFVAEATRMVWDSLNTRHNFSVIHNGLDMTRLRAEATEHPRDVTRARLQIADDEVAVLLPGTVCERKGQLDLIRAVAQLSQTAASRLRCYIVGDRDSKYSAELHSMRDALPADRRERVQIVAETREIFAYYQASDIFVCCSRVESFPRVVLEAMAFGLPVISARVFGVVEQVSNNVNALLYEPGDVEVLAFHLEKLINSDDLRARLASNARPMLGTLNTYDEMLAAYAEVFNEAALTTPKSLEGVLAS